MADLVGSLEKIIKVGMEIKSAVETVQRNKEECCEIEERVVIVEAIMTHLSKATEEMIEKKMEVPNKNPAMDSALADLHKTLRRALKLVRDCQEKSALCLFCTAGDLSKQLCRVQDDISRKMMSVQFATTVHVTFLIIGLNRQGACPPPPQPKEPGEVKVTHGDNSTSHASGTSGDDKKETEVETGGGVPFATLPPGLKWFSLSQLEAATNNFSDDMLIGPGGFSKVYKGKLHDGLVVAVKKFKATEVLNRLISELEIGAKLEHKNVIKYLGYCMDSKMAIVEHLGKKILCKQHNCFLVLDYLPNGSLEEITKGTRRVDWSSCFRIIQGTAQGLRYLHEQRILHMDLKPSNILLDSDMNPVITDFGLSRIDSFSDHHSPTSPRIAGSLGYMAPEYMLRGKVSSKTDVFSFGVILRRIICSCFTASYAGRETWDPENWDKMLKEAGGVEGLLHRTVEVDESQLKEINRCMEVALLCVDYDGSKRPTMEQVVEMLSGEKEPRTPGNRRTKGTS